MNIALLSIPFAIALFAAMAPNSTVARPRQILMLVTGADKTRNGKQTGIWLEEFAIPYRIFTDAGYQVTVASPKGGKTPLDPGSINELNNPQWRDAVARLDTTAPLNRLSANEFDAIFLPGGHGTMFDLPDNKEVQRILGEFAAQNKVIGAVCHGPAGLVGVKRADGSFLVAGKTITAFTDAEESAVGMVEEMPFLLESKLRAEGAKFVVADKWADHVEVDGRLVTGQNPASSKSTAEAVVQLLR